MHKGPLAQCLWRGYGGWFSPSTPRLDEGQADVFTPLELRLYQHAKDHRLLTWDILGYPKLFGDILCQLLISKVIPFSGRQWRSEEQS